MISKLVVDAGDAFRRIGGQNLQTRQISTTAFTHTHTGLIETRVTKYSEYSATLLSTNSSYSSKTKQSKTKKFPVLPAIKVAAAVDYNPQQRQGRTAKLAVVVVV